MNLSLEEIDCKLIYIRCQRERIFELTEIDGCQFNIQVDVDGSGFVEFPEFCNLMYKKIRDSDTENELKETFRVFSKDNEGKQNRMETVRNIEKLFEGCITADELKFVLTHLPGKVLKYILINCLRNHYIGRLPTKKLKK